MIFPVMNIESIFKIIYYSYRLHIKIKWAIQNLKIACTAAVVLSAVAVVVIIIFAKRVIRPQLRFAMINLFP